MKKLLIAVFLLFAMHNSAAAHSGLESSDPSNGAVLTKSPSKIVLTFSSKVESAGEMVLKNEKGEKTPFSHVDLKDDVMTGTLESKLPNNHYKLEWNIIGLDGHPIMGVIDFTVESTSQKSDKITTVNKDFERVKLPVHHISAKMIYLLFGGLAMAAIISSTILFRRPPR